MEYGLLLSLDQDYEPVGLFSFFTNQGPIVVVFTTEQSLATAAWGAAHTVAEDMKIGSTTVEADSPEMLLQSLMDMGLEAGEASFVLDTDPIGRELVQSVAGQE